MSACTLVRRHLDPSAVSGLGPSGSRRTMFLVGDAGWTRTFAEWVNLALDDPGAAVVAVDRHGGRGPIPGSDTPPAGRPDTRPAHARLQELDDLRRDGLLTDGEYRAQRASIISQV